MICYVTGILGAGKSYYGARKIADGLLRGKVVATNMQLVEGWEELILKRSPYYRASSKKEGFRKELRSRYAYIPDAEYLISATIKGKGESRGIRVLDEAHNELNNREWMAENQKTILRRMALARKRGWDDYILAQHKDNTDMALRRISGVEVKLVNWRQVLKVPFFQTQLLPFHLFLAMAFSMNSHVRREKKVLWRELYGLGWQSKIYDTFEDFDSRGGNVIDLRSKEGFPLPRLPHPGGYDFSEIESARALRFQEGWSIIGEEGSAAPTTPKGATMPFTPATPTVSAKGVERSDVLELLAIIPDLPEGEFASDGVLYEDRSKANAMAAKYIRVAESMENVSLRSRTWEHAEGGGWHFGIRYKESEPVAITAVPTPEPTPAASRPQASRSSRGR